VKKTTSTITVGGKKIGEVSATSRPVVRYKHKPQKGREAEIRHQQLLNKITRFGTIKKVKGKKGKRRK